VRSTTLDIQIWEPNMIAMLEALGNEMVNMVMRTACAVRAAPPRA
jgi:hypothetical protein